MNGHDEETYERKDLPTAFISREEHERILKEYKDALKICIDELIYESVEPGIFWMWGRNGGTKVPERIENVRKLLD